MTIPWNRVRYLRLARAVLADGRLPELLLAVARKSRASASRLAGAQGDVQLLIGLCAAWWRGEYRGIGRPALLAVVATLLYFLVPLDMLPDWLLAVGLLDDLAVLGWLMRTWQAELQAYRAWRESQPGEALRQLEALPAEDEVH
ncbi:DUF1232 domain-containing protein [Pseudomonas sp. CAU 1711]|uniref:YkvA family protein n=1 Tax=Pseudomonas sp. CAU 1711 TaxID=3140356 RepID=UPI003261C05A